MTVLWRIDKAKRGRKKSFSGEGAALTGGRWNLPGTRVVYAAESLALAALEKLVHLGDEGRRIRWVAYEIHVPEGVVVERVRPNDLPRNWRSHPPPGSTMELGSQWAREQRGAVLMVPSAIIQVEHNALINPLHPEFRRLKISRGKPFRFDDRLWK